jgi:hypothetical protein
MQLNMYKTLKVRPHPSNRMGFNSALAAYTAAVCAAGPLPMMQTLVCSLSAGILAAALVANAKV